MICVSVLPLGSLGPTCTTVGSLSVVVVADTTLKEFLGRSPWCCSLYASLLSFLKKEMCRRARLL